MIEDAAAADGGDGEKVLRLRCAAPPIYSLRVCLHSMSSFFLDHGPLLRLR